LLLLLGVLVLVLVLVLVAGPWSVIGGRWLAFDVQWADG
jgi:hypothetical protein